MQNFQTIQLDRLHFLDSYAIGHAGQGIIAEGKMTLPRHYHGNQYELTCILQGEGTAYYNETPHPVKAGDVFVSFPYEYHKIEVKPGTVIHQSFVTFSVNGGKYIDQLNHLWLDNIAPEKRTFCDAHVPELIETVIEELQNGALYENEMLSAVTEELAIRILRGMAGFEVQTLPVNPTPNDLCRHIKHYISTHLFTMKSLSEVAVAVSYNYSYLSTCFKRTTGQTMTEYYIYKRMQAAKELIHEQKSSLTEIARILGFSGIYSFSKAFRDYYGMSPRAYQNSLKEHS